jgi:hypothetical protein
MWPFAAEAVAPPHGEARLDQTPAHEAGGGEGGQGGAGAAVGGQFGEQAGLPHVRVAGRGEAVQEPRRHVGGALAPERFRVAEHQRQGDVVRQLQPVVTGAGGRVLIQQRPGGLAQLRPVGQGAGQVVALQRVLSTDHSSRPAPAGASARKRWAASSMLRPVPKPVSPITKRSPSVSAAKRESSRLPSRNTKRLSARPSWREK